MCPVSYFLNQNQPSIVASIGKGLDILTTPWYSNNSTPALKKQKFYLPQWETICSFCHKVQIYLQVSQSRNNSGIFTFKIKNFSLVIKSLYNFALCFPTKVQDKVTAKYWNLLSKELRLKMKQHCNQLPRTHCHLHVSLRISTSWIFYTI